MGGSESFVGNYIKQYGIEGLFKLILLKKKISWLKENCLRQINLKVDDEIKYILFQMDQTINEKKQMTQQYYKQTKLDLMQRQASKIKVFEQNNGRLLQNVYGKNLIFDKLNSLKINFHIETHLSKKKIKKSIEQKIAAMENYLLYQTNDIPIQKHTIEICLKESTKHSELVLDNPQLKSKLEEFKNQIIAQLNFDLIFWPSFDTKIRQTQREAENICNEAKRNISTMKSDLQGDWSFFKT